MPPDTNNPSDPSATPPVPPPPSSAEPQHQEVPVFHNPLAQGYAQNTAQLPPLAPSAGVTPDLQESPVVAPPPHEPISEVLPTPEGTSPLDDELSVIPPPAPITPAPVRLAPTPQSTATSYSMPTSNVAPQPVPTNTAPPMPKSNVPKRGPYRLVMIGLIVLVVLGGIFIGLRLTTQKQVATPTPSTAAKPIRDTAEKQLAAGYERLDTGCYTVQIPTAPRVDINKDCQLSAFYGAQKASSVVISTFRDFDFVAQDASSASPSPSSTETRTGQRFDSQKIMEALITNATTGKSISAREDIKVGNIDAVKVVGAAQAGGNPVYINVFIVLPETDQQFGDKNYIAFTITGAYNDNFSRKSFDHVLESWQWK